MGKKELKDYPYILLGFRINLKTADEDPSQFTAQVADYLKHRGWKIIRSSGGIHIENCKNPHIHLHYEVCPQSLTKLYCQEKYPYNIYLRENNLEIKDQAIKREAPKVEEGDTDVESAVLRFLRYPLKEGKPISTSCLNIDVDTLMLEAQAHWKLAKEQHHKDEVKKEQDKLKWNQIVKYLDDKKPTEYVEVFSELIEYTRNENPPMTTKILNTKTINYMKLRKLLTNYDLIRVENFGTRILLKNDKPCVPPPFGKTQFRCRIINQ